MLPLFDSRRAGTIGAPPSLEIIVNAIQAFGLQVENTSAYRIAMISDGFPHYVHLITEKLLWHVFEDPDLVTITTPQHYTDAIEAAVLDIEPHLKAMYEKASLKQITRVFYAQS
jgi:uncharacterized protein